VVPAGTAATAAPIVGYWWTVGLQVPTATVAARAAGPAKQAANTSTTNRDGRKNLFLTIDILQIFGLSFTVFEIGVAWPKKERTSGGIAKWYW
jgi:hypothetical protein